MTSYLYFSSLREFLRPRRLIAWIALAIAGMALALAWPRLNPEASPAEQYASVSAMLVFHVLALASAIFTAAIVSQEVEQKTIVYLLTRPVSRWKLLLSRYAASATVVAALGILGAALVSVGVYHGDFLGSALFHRDVVAVVFGAFAYGALFLLVTLLINRAMIVCLLFAFGWETIVPNMPGEMYHLSIYSHVLAIADHPSNPSVGGAGSFGSGALNASVITPQAAMTTLVVLTLILLAVSALWFTRFEFVPREDAE